MWTSQDVSQAAHYLLGLNRLKDADIHQAARFCQQVEKECMAIVGRKQQHELRQLLLDADSTATDQTNLLSP